MADYFKETQISFPILVLEQIRIIQKITSRELRDSTRIIKTPIGDQIFENEDTRYSFLQAVEILGSMLAPWFTPDNQKDFESFTTSSHMELVQAWKEEDFKKDAKEILEISEDEIDSISKEIRIQLLTYLLNEKCKSAQDTFKMLVKCFKENDFLAGESYGENQSDDDGSTADGDEEGDFEG